jgi:hypothetical protein
MYADVNTSCPGGYWRRIFDLLACLIEKSLSLRLFDGGKLLEKLVEGVPKLQMVKQRSYGNARSCKTGRSTKNLRVDLNYISHQHDVISHRHKWR